MRSDFGCASPSFRLPVTYENKTGVSICSSASGGRGLSAMERNGAQLIALHSSLRAATRMGELLMVARKRCVTAIPLISCIGAPIR
jgi:hypothetical protein